jgi:cell division protease FtsH
MPESELPVSTERGQRRRHSSLPLPPPPRSAPPSTAPPSTAPSRRISRLWRGGQLDTTPLGQTDVTRHPRSRRWIWIAVAAIAVNWLLVSVLDRSATAPSVSYSAFRAQVTADNVAKLTSKGDTIEGTFRTPIDDTEGGHKNVTDFKTQRPTFADDQLLEVLLSDHVIVNAQPLSTATAWWVTLLLSFGPAILLVGGSIWLFRRMGRGLSGMGGIGGLGKSKAVRYDTSRTRTTFADVAGIDEAKDELVEVVDFLRSPEKYRALGARTPRGVLLMGPPGTGKTLLARAVAGEADVPFFSMSASEFIEMIVGVGASRVRDLFDQAKAVAPAIVFIDELDAIGRARGGGASFGGVDEREQTLNQILTEMDGFTGNEGVIVLAATNRPEILDPALLRAGRFDRRIAVNPPDRNGRAAILAVHTRSVPLGADADLDVIAATTPGMVGADLANLVNEAALLAARRGRTTVALADFTDALERIVLGAERKIMMTEDDRRRTAYHESGHALLGMLLPGADPVRKVSITPRGRTLGVTFQSPNTDRYGMTEEYLRTRITGALGGSAAERLIFGNITTGAESDLEQITTIARQMVGRWGMSAAIGSMSVLPTAGEETGLFGLDPRTPSDATRALVDSEVRRIVDECQRRAEELLGQNRERLERLALTLLDRETLDEQQAYVAAGVEH